MSEWAADRESGSSDVALAFLSDLERWSAADGSASARELYAALLRRLRAAQAAQPTMALVHQLGAIDTRGQRAGSQGAEHPPPRSH